MPGHDPNQNLRKSKLKTVDAPHIPVNDMLQTASSQLPEIPSYPTIDHILSHFNSFENIQEGEAHGAPKWSPRTIEFINMVPTSK